MDEGGKRGESGEQGEVIRIGKIDGGREER